MAKKKTHKEEGNLYDKILKENAEQLFLPLIEEQLGIKIKSFQPFQEKMQTTIEREMDFFYEIKTEDNEEFLLHLEFQADNDEEMLYRAAEYHGMALRRHKIPIKHIIIFLGDRKMTMKTKLDQAEIFEGFEVINVHTMNTSTLLSSQVPEIVLLSVLSDYPKEKSEAILRLVVQQLKQVCKNKSELSRYLKQLIILARLRKFEDIVTKIVNAMPITYDITTDYLFKQGLEKGVTQGLKQGLKQGIEQGLAQGLKQAIKKDIVSTRNMLLNKFDTQLIAKLLNLKHDFVLQVKEQLKSEKKILSRLKRKQKIATIAKALKVPEIVVEVLKDLQEKKEL